LVELDSELAAPGGGCCMAPGEAVFVDAGS
jgi:hypothetical protein